MQNCMNFTSKTDLENFKLNIENMIKFISYKNFSSDTEADSKRFLLIGGIKAAFYIILIVIALFGNLLIIAVIFFNKFLRKPTNYYILNLAICDLAIVFTSMCYNHVYLDICGRNIDSNLYLSNLPRAKMVRLHREVVRWLWLAVWAGVRFKWMRY